MGVRRAGEVKVEVQIHPFVAPRGVIGGLPAAGRLPIRSLRPSKSSCLPRSASPWDAAVHGEYARGAVKGLTPMSLSRLYFSLANTEPVEAAAVRGFLKAGTGAAVWCPDFACREGRALGHVKRQLVEAPPGSELGFWQWRGREKMAKYVAGYGERKGYRWKGRWRAEEASRLWARSLGSGGVGARRFKIKT
jgi:hypothetical protein